MAELLAFLPLFTETIETIRARVDADANAGVAPDDPGYIDTTPGGFYWDLTQAVLLEVERLWDVASVDLPASMFVGFAWGDYLDEHGAVLDVPRKDAVKASGTVTFTGSAGTLVGTHARVGTTQIDPDADPVEFETTESGTIPGGGTLTLAVQAVEAGTLGNVATGAANVLVSPIEGVAAVGNPAAITGGAEIESDEAYRTRIVLEYQAAQGGGNAADYERWALAYAGVGYVNVVPLWAGPGTVRVVITDDANHPCQQATIDGLQETLDPIEAATQLDGDVTLPAATIDVVDTSGFRPDGTAVIDGGQIVLYTGVTATTLTGCTGGSGLVAGGSSVEQHGLGGGQAPVGAIVDVVTPTAVSVDVQATVTFEAGYSLDGDAGTVATRADLEAMVGGYLDGLRPGSSVYYNSVVARFFLVTGVADVDMQYDDGGGWTTNNLEIEDDEVAEAGTMDLS